MKKTFTLVCFTVFCNYFMIAQSLVWTQQTTGIINNLRSVYFTGANTGYAVGSGGTILKTTNGGSSWISQTSGTYNTLNAVFFINANTGYAVGDGGDLLKTTNGGSNWTYMSSGTTRSLYSVHFIDANTGYIAGGFYYNGSSYSVIRKTTNGGATWTSLANGASVEIRSIYFTDSLTGYAAGYYGAIFKTINGGTQWTQKYYNTISYNYLYSLSFPDNNTAYAVGVGKILKTSNGGNNWNENININLLNSVCFTDTSSGYAVGYHGKIIQTQNGGLDWAEQQTGITSTLNSVYFTNSNIGYAVGDSGVILKTIIGGAPTAGSNAAVCEGTTLSLTASTISGASYYWTGPNGFTSTQQNPVVSNNATLAMNGTYNVTATVNGITSLAGPVLVVVNSIPPKPIAGSNSPVVVGSSVLLSASTITGAIYNWFGPNNFTSTSQNPSINNATLPMTGIYKVTSTVNGCTSPVDSIMVIINNFTANDSACGTEEFNNGITAPLGWTYTNINSTYTTAINCGNLIPSLMLDATGDAIETAPVHNVSKLSFWIKGNSTDVISSLLVEGFNGITWTTIDNITNLSTVGSTKIYTNVVSYTRFKFTYNKSAGNLAIDDIEIICGTIPVSPIAGNNGPLCEGSQLNLTASTIQGAIYNWSGPNGFLSTQQNPVVSSNATLLMSGTYYVTATVNGLTSLAGSTIVTVHGIPSPPITGIDTMICSGSSLSLRASTVSGASYSWTGPNGFISSQQNPTVSNNSTIIMSGTYYVNVIVYGCSSQVANTIVTVNAIPSAPTAGNNGQVCVGSLLSLTASTIPGAAYSWTGPNGYLSSQQNPTVSNNSTISMSGTYYVTAIVNGCSSQAANTIVTVNTIPSAPIATNNGAVCTGSLLSLSASYISGALYSWTGPNGFISTQQNPTVSNNAAITMSGIYSVAATVNGCISAAGTTNVTVKVTPSAPVAGNNGPVCTGSLLSLTASNLSGANYIWTGPDGFNSLQQNPTVSNNATITMSGIYSVTATVNGCTSTAGTTTATVKTTPSAPVAGNNGAVIAGSLLSLYASTISGAIYSWSGPDGFISNLQNPIVSNNATLAMAGIYYVTATVIGCTSQAGSTLVIVNSSIPNDSACGTEEFSNGIIAPSGWIFTNIGSTYQTTINSGNAIPSLTFDASGDVVETAPVHNVSNLSFWIKGISTDAASSLLIQGYNGLIWTTIDNFSNLPAVGTFKTYNNVSTYSRFKFLYIQSAGNLAFDDLKIICGPLSISENQSENTISIFPNPTTGNITLNIPKNTKCINILNSVGQLINSSQTEGEKSIDFNIERAGIYFLQVIGLKEIITKKVIVY